MVSLSVKFFFPTMLLLAQCSSSTFSSGVAGNRNSNQEEYGGPELPDETGVGENPGDLLTKEDVLALCSSQTPQQLSEFLQFPKTTKGACLWGQNENLSELDGHLRARVEQDRPLTLPQGAVICSLAINSNNQSFYYDDQLMLALSNQVLLSSNRKFTDQLLEVDGLIQYDWVRMRDGMGINYGYNGGWNSSGIHCLSNNCQLPNTQTQGQLSISVTDELASKLSAQINNLGEAVFKVVTVGDDDSDSDCYHSGFKLNVTGTYVIKP